jgi:hypothetical protein
MSQQRFWCGLCDWRDSNGACGRLSEIAMKIPLQIVFGYMFIYKMLLKHEMFVNAQLFFNHTML